MCAVTPDQMGEVKQLDEEGASRPLWQRADKGKARVSDTRHDSKKVDTVIN